VVALGRGSVALVPFPFSDLSQAKLRPAIVLASVGRGDWILCQVTSNEYGDDRAIRGRHRLMSPPGTVTPLVAGGYNRPVAAVSPSAG